MVRYAAIIGLAALTAGLWALYGLSGDYRVFGGVSTANVLIWVAWLATALLLIVVLARLVVGVGFALFDRDATGLQRGIVYAVITFVVVSLILGNLGMNVTAILTTSVLATAVVGLAMQPTLGGLIAGSALQLDRVLHVGDVILLNQERIEVIALTWRSVVGRKHGGALVVIPNARVSDTPMEIVRGDQASYAEISVPALGTVAPHRVSDALSEAIDDLPFVDPARPVEIAPREYQAIDGFIHHRVGFWVRHSQDVGEAQRMLMSRAWYAFQREDIPWRAHANLAPPESPAPDTEPFKGKRLDQLGDLRGTELQSIVLARGLAADLTGRTIAECGPPLYYADGERILRPHRARSYSLFLLAEGEVREASGAAWRDGAHGTERSAMLASRGMAIERITSHLARRIGPYAETAVREAAAVDPNPLAVRTAVAAEIEDAPAREIFLRSLHLDDEVTHKAGLVFGLQSGAYRRVSSPPLRAVRRAIVIPIVLS